MNPDPLPPDSRQEERSAALTEAHARIVWGDDGPGVVFYLKTQGFSADEAADAVKGFVKERNRDIRARGLVRAIIGVVCLALAGLFFDVEMNSSSVDARSRGGGLATAVFLVLGGGWLLINGLWMVFSPKSEHGDLADE